MKKKVSPLLRIFAVVLITAIVILFAITPKGGADFSVVGWANPTGEISDANGGSEDVVYVYNKRLLNKSWIPSVVTAVSGDDFYDFYLCQDGIDGYDGTVLGLGGSYLRSTFSDKYDAILSERSSQTVNSRDFIVILLSDEYISDVRDVEVTIYYRLLNLFPAQKTLSFNTSLA